MSTLNPYAGGTIPLSPNAVPLGMNSQIGRDEWQEFLARRRELIETGMQNLQLSMGFAQQTGMIPQQAFQATSLLMPPSQGEQDRAARQQMSIDDAEYNRLLGAADFYGIDNAQSLDPNELRRQIEIRRDYLVSERMEEEPSVGGAIYDTIATFLGTTGLSAVDAVAGGLTHIPWVGDALRKREGFQRYRRGLAMLEEGFTGDMIDAERASYEKFARPLQHFLGYSALVGVAAEGVGATGFAAGIANPLVRGSLQGAATGWVLEGGGDESIADRALKIGLFGATQGLGEWGLPKIAARLSRSFPRSSQWGAFEAQMGRAGTGPGTVDAEWAFFDEAAGSLGAGPRLIGPGGAAGGAAPPGTPRLGPGGIPGTPTVPDEVLAAEAGGMAVGPLGTGPMPAPTGMQLPAGVTRPGTMQVAAGMTQFPRGQQMLTMEAAGADAIAATKQGIILESPALPALAKQPTLQDADVALAAIATNPGQISVVQGVGDSAGTIRRFLQEFLPNGVGPQDFRAVTRRVVLPIRLGAMGEEGAHFALPGPSTYYDPSEALADPSGGFYDIAKANVMNLGNPANARSVLAEAISRHADDSMYVTKAQEAMANVEYGLTYVEVEELALDEIVRSRGFDGVKFFENDDIDVPGTVNVWNLDKVRQVPKELLTEEGELVRIDILVADGRPITNKMVKEYQEFGMFRGQQAIIHGQQVRIESLNADVAEVVSMTGKKMTVPLDELMPGKASMIADSAPEAYIEAKGYALSRMAMEAQDSGLAPFDWFSDEMATQLPRYIDEFLSMKKVEGTSARAVYTASFTEARVREFKTLAPEEFAQAEAIEAEVAQIVLRNAATGSRSLTIEEVAEMKGMQWIATPNTMGGSLIDSFSGELVALDSQEAAFQFLLDFNRTMPDHTPFTTVPGELASGPVGFPGEGSSRSPAFFGTADDIVAEGHRELDHVEAMFAEGGGGAGMPPGGLPPGAPGGMYPGGEFGALKDASFGKYRQLEVRFDRTIRHWLEPMRGYAARITEDLNRFGIRANYWEDVVTIENASATAHNEIEPWSREFSEALARIRNRRVRDGSVVLIGELPPEQALAAMRNAGYTQREFEGQQRLRELWGRVGDEYGVRKVLDYWPHLRSADSPEQAAQKILQYDFTGPGRWFAEQVRQGGIDYREMNAEVLINKWLRGAAFSRHVAPHVDRMTTAWVQDSRIPTNLREVTSNWLSLVTTGYVPGGGRLFEGVAATLQSAKIPMNTRDVEVMARWALSNTYRGLLGGRPVAVIREMINPLLAWARIGHTRDLGGAMVRFARDAGYRQEALERGVQGGWVMRYAYGELSQEPLRAGGRAAIPGIQTPENEFSYLQNTVREGAARIGDVVTDATHRVLPRGFNNSIIDPLKPMDKINEFGRLIAGESGYQAMARALSEYNAARNASGAIVDAKALNAQLLLSSGAANLHESVQRSIVRMVEGGDFESAKNLFANEVANQLARFGAMDQPVAAHSTGVIGKLGLQFGNFAIQYQAGMREGLGMSGLAREFGGSGLSKVTAGTKFAGRHAIIAGGLSLAGGYTAWNFKKWFWHGSLGWGGGPMLMAALDEFRSTGARYKQMLGEPLTPVEKALLVDTGRGGLGESMVNPYLGATRTIEQLGIAASSSNPLENAAQFMVTGQMGGAEFNRQLNEATWGAGPTPAWMQGQVPQAQPVVPMGGGGQF